jgi:acylphosphatase
MHSSSEETFQCTCLTFVTIAAPLAQLNAQAQNVSAVSGIVTGNVQEVGFRAMIQRRAIQYNLAGSVENENDKSVQFFLQGDKDRRGAKCYTAGNQKIVRCEC